MDTYANILLITIPIFLILIIIEISYGVWKNDLKHSYMDTISSLSSGFTNLMVDILGLGIIILSYPFFYERLKVIELEESVLLYFIALSIKLLNLLLIKFFLTAIFYCICLCRFCKLLSSQTKTFNQYFLEYACNPS